ncbi:hypothetical protein AZF01_07790 [Martelella sp. AD-3]|nr:hypothetical protein AZF01_07790 [Martelella sp. AD-3]
MSTKRPSNMSDKDRPKHRRHKRDNELDRAIAIVNLGGDIRAAAAATGVSEARVQQACELHRLRQLTKRHQRHK